MERTVKDHAARLVIAEAENRLWLSMKRKKHAHGLMASLILSKRIVSIRVESVENLYS